MEVTEYQPGTPSWVDLGTSDVEAAARFYQGLFGWVSEEGPPEAGGYRMCLLDGQPVAGLGPQMNPGPPVWSAYVTVADADATANAAKAAGGQVIVEPMDVLDVGRMAIFADPVGAVISIWEPRAHRGAGRINEPGTFSWAELQTSDLDRSREFYGRVFDWGAEDHGEGPGGYTEFQLQGRSVAGMMPKPPMVPAEVPPYWAVYFSAADTDAAVARAVELGAEVVAPAMDIEPGRFAVLRDPTGAVFCIIALKPELAGQ